MSTQKQAIAALQAMYGKEAAYRINKKAATPAERDAAREQLPALRERVEQAKLAMENKRKELLQDPQYQRLVQDWRDANDARERACSKVRSRRITIGKANKLFFHVTGEGDTWDEALAEARRRQL